MMESFEKQLEEFKLVFPEAQVFSEGGFQYVFLKRLKLPSGCAPGEVDALLCPQKRDGYESRLFFSEMFSDGSNHNWNGLNMRILSKNWFAISWKTPPGLTVKDMFYSHFNAFHNGK